MSYTSNVEKRSTQSEVAKIWLKKISQVTALHDHNEYKLTKVKRAQVKTGYN